MATGGGPTAPGPPAAPAESSAAAAAAATEVPIGEELTIEEFNRLWMLGMSDDRSLGRPKEWSGDDKSFDDFTDKFENWLMGMPGNVEQLLSEAKAHPYPLAFAHMDDRAQIIAKGVMRALRSLVSGRALNIVKSSHERSNGLEAWRL